MRRWLAITLIFIAVIGIGAVGIYYPRVGNSQTKANEAFYKAMQLHNDYQYRAATDWFLKALSFNPEFHLARRWLGQSLYYSGDVDEAVNEWKIILDQGYYDPSLQLHVQNLTSATVAGQLNLVFEKKIGQQAFYRYQMPTFVSALRNHNVFFLAMGKVSGNMIELNPNGELTSNYRRISSRVEVPMGAAQNASELWVTDFKKDTIHRLNLVKRNWANRFFQKDNLGKKGSGDLEFHGPTGICHQQGFFYVVDSGNNRVQKIDSQGRFTFSFSKIEASRLNQPFGIACTRKGTIYVSEPEESRISVFDKFGNFQRFMGINFLKKPRHLSIDQGERYLIIADETEGVFIIDLSNNERIKIEGYTNKARKFIKFNRPYSASLDYFGNLFVANFGESEILKFVPEHFMYSNLELWVERIYNKNFPNVGVWVSVKNQSGKFLEDLTGDNFRINENDSDMGRISASYLKQFDEQASMMVLVSRSKYMKAYADSLNWIADFFIKNLRQKDRVMVMSYGDDYRSDSPFTNSRLRIRQAIQTAMNENAESENSPALGTGFYASLSKLLPEQGKRALIWITAGDLPIEGLGKISLTRLENYAYINHIPVYIINFEYPEIAPWKENRIKLKQFAERTGGKYFHAYDAKLKNIEKAIRAKKRVRYLLVYESEADSDWQKQFIDLRVNVNFQGRTGVETAGYFIPEDK